MTSNNNRSLSPSSSDSHSYDASDRERRGSPPRYFNHGRRRPERGYGGRPDRDGQFYVAESGYVRRGDSPEYDEFRELELEMLPNKYNYDLETEPEPELTPEEHALPKFQKNLRIIMKKCQKIKCYNFFPVETVVEAVKESSFPPLLVEDVAKYLSGEGPHEFYLRWAVDADKVELINRWLTAHIMESELEQKLNTEEVRGTMVSAFGPREGFYQRATAMTLDEITGMVMVFLVDAGRIHFTGMDQLKDLPPELTEVEPVSFKCRLAGIDYINDDAVLDYWARFDFTRLMGCEGTLKCTLKGYNEKDKVWDVALRKVNVSTNLDMDVNEHIRSEYFQRKAFVNPDDIPQDPRENIRLEFCDIGRKAPLTSRFTEGNRSMMKGLRIFRVVHVEHPWQFYVQYPEDENYAGIGVSEISTFQAYYDSVGDREEHRLCTSRAIPDRAYAWRDPITGQWERVRVSDTNNTTQTSQIFLVDVGRSCEVSNHDLRELQATYASEVARGFRAHLIDVKPTDGGNTWSQESIEGFKSLAEGKLFHGVIMARANLPSSGNMSNCETISLGLVLVEKDPKVKLCLNAQLCASGWAECTGLSSAVFSLNIPGPVTQPFNIAMVRSAVLANERKWRKEHGGKDLESEGAVGGKPPAPAYPLPRGPPEILSRKEKKALLSDKEDGVESYGLYYRTFMTKSLRTDEGMDDRDRLPMEIRLRLNTCVLTHIVSPSCFYIQMVPQIPELKTMMQYLTEQVNDLPEMQEEDAMDGHLVAVYLLDENGKPTWHRGIVRHSIFSIRLIKVILLDFGNEVSVKYSTVRRLPEYFCNIPGFAQRVHLDVRNLLPLGGSGAWSSSACDCFRKYMAVWEAELPVYYIWKPPGAALIPLEECSQELTFNVKTKVWEKGDGRDLLHQQNVKLIAHHPAAQNVLLSMGVDIVYEIIQEGDCPYGFEKIWDILVDKGLAIVTTDPSPN